MKLFPCVEPSTLRNWRAALSQRGASILAPDYLSPTVATLLLMLATAGFGTTPFFAKSLTNEGLASSSIIFYRNIFPALLLFPTLSLAPHKRSATLWIIGAGFAMGLGWISYVEALKSAPVAAVGVIYMTYPLFTLLLGLLWMGQVPARKTWLAGLLVLVAALVALSPESIGDAPMQTLLLSFGSPLGLAFGIMVIANKTSTLTPIERVAGSSLGSSASLLPMVWTLETSALIPNSSTAWLLILGLTFAAKFIPSFLYNMASPMIGSARTAIAGSIELPVMFVVGVLAFGEQITLPQYVAAALVMASIWMTSVNRRRRSVQGNSDHTHQVKGAKPRRCHSVWLQSLATRALATEESLDR